MLMFLSCFKHVPSAPKEDYEVLGSKTKDGYGIPAFYLSTTPLSSLVKPAPNEEERTLINEAFHNKSFEHPVHNRQSTLDHEEHVSLEHICFPERSLDRAFEYRGFNLLYYFGA